MRIEGAVALVTGGASGLGRATAEGLVAAGARVVLADLASSDGAAVAEGLGDAARFVPTDVTSEDDVARALDAADALGGARVVVSCAEIVLAQRVLGRSGVHALDAFRRVVDVNLVGTFNVVRLAAERMLALDPLGPDGPDPDGEERGVVVQTASVAAFDGQVGQAAYAASKAGVA
ncbi:MAG: SDR family NAD(P)-dependent oxidoreductase, partial [Cellulosimicrobium funkei]